MDEIFEQEKRNAGLENVDIRLRYLTLSNYRGVSPADARRIRDGVYGITIRLSPDGIEGHSSRASKLSRMTREGQLRYLMRHELAHIRNGDCDRVARAKRAWPFRLANKVYEFFVEEPRAARYGLGYEEY